MSARDRRATGGDVRIRDPQTGATLDYETAMIVRHDPAGWSDPLRAWVDIRRKMRERFTVYNVWRLLGVRNPANVAAGKIGGKTAAAFMTPKQRENRARRAGNVSMHGDPLGSDGTTASARGLWLARRRWTGKRTGPTPLAEAHKALIDRCYRTR